MTAFDIPAVATFAVALAVLSGKLWGLALADHLERLRDER